MYFDRISAKVSARMSMRLNRPHAVWVTLVYYLLTGVLFAGVSRFSFQDLAQFYTSRVSVGYPSDQVILYMLRQFPGLILTALAIQLVWGIYDALMSFGYTSYALRLARNEQPGFGHLFDGFARFGRVLWAAILTQVFTLLWSLAVILPMCALIILAGYLTQSYSVIMLLTFLAILAGTTTHLFVSYRYRLTSYFLLDHPHCTAREAVRRSVATMKGRKTSLLMLDLSFLGWILLSALVSMLLSLVLAVMLDDVLCFWILPYHKATEANFYDFATAATPSGDRAGPRYDQTTDGPVPF